MNKKKQHLYVCPTELYELEDEREAKEFDEDFMPSDKPYFVGHEGISYFVDVEDIDNDTRVHIEQGSPPQTVPGFWVKLTGDREIAAARTLLETGSAYVHGCIIRYDGMTQLLVTHNIDYLKHAIEGMLNKALAEQIA